MKGRRILYVQYTDPGGYPPTQHSSGILAERGWDVVFLGTWLGPSCDLRLPSRPRVRVKQIRSLQDGWKQKLQYVLFFFWSLSWTLSWRPDWIYASDPLCAPILWFVRKLSGVRVLYHEHDSPNLDQVQSWFMRVIFEYRRKLGREAELCVFPQRTRLREFLEITERSGPVFCVWNCPRLDEVEVNEPSSSGEGKLILYYHGSITRARLPVQLIVAAARFKGAVRLRIVGYETSGNIGYSRELRRISAENGVADLIDFLGAVSRNDLMHRALEAHVGLALMPKRSQDINLRHMVGASNKPFDYMACGLPLLVTDMPEWESTFVEPGYGRACDPEDPDSIEAELRWLLEHSEERAEMGRRCRDKVREAWNYEVMFSEVLASLEHD